MLRRSGGVIRRRAVDASPVVDAGDFRAIGATLALVDGVPSSAPVCRSPLVAEDSLSAVAGIEAGKVSFGDTVRRSCPDS